MAPQTKRAATQAALNGQPAADETTDQQPANQRPADASERKAAENDSLYAKALNEEDDYTLVPKDKVAENQTVEKVSDKVYPNDMVIAKRK